MSRSYNTINMTDKNGITTSLIYDCDVLNAGLVNTSNLNLSNNIISLDNIPVGGPYTVHPINIKYVKVGRMVSLYLPYFVYPADTTGVINFNIPSEITPAFDVSFPLMTVEGPSATVFQAGHIDIFNSSIVQIYPTFNLSPFVIDDYIGFNHTVISYIV